jgi:hypothetical protein
MAGWKQGLPQAAKNYGRSTAAGIWGLFSPGVRLVFEIQRGWKFWQAAPLRSSFPGPGGRLTHRPLSVRKCNFYLYKEEFINGL